VQVVEVVEAAVVRVWSAADRQRVLARQAAVNCCERPRIFRSPTRVEAEPVEDDGESVAPDIAEPGERQLHTDDACVEADRRSCLSTMWRGYVLVTRSLKLQHPSGSDECTRTGSTAWATRAT
jgi:hypothetical protein